MPLQQITENWKKRIVNDIQVINQIRLDLLELSQLAEDAELSAIAERLNSARCALANTITLRMLLNGASTQIMSDAELAECHDLETKAGAETDG